MLRVNMEVREMSLALYSSRQIAAVGKVADQMAVTAFKLAKDAELRSRFAEEVDAQIIVHFEYLTPDECAELLNEIEREQVHER